MQLNNLQWRKQQCMIVYIVNSEKKVWNTLKQIKQWKLKNQAVLNMISPLCHAYVYVLCY